MKKIITTILVSICIVVGTPFLIGAAINAIDEQGTAIRKENLQNIIDNEPWLITKEFVEDYNKQMPASEQITYEEVIYQIFESSAAYENGFLRTEVIQMINKNEE